MAHPAQDEDRQLQHVREDLLREFTGLSPQVVDALFAQVVHRFHQAPVRSFVPVLVRRDARQRLKQLA